MAISQSNYAVSPIDEKSFFFLFRLMDVNPIKGLSDFIPAIFRHYFVYALSIEKFTMFSISLNYSVIGSVHANTVVPLLSNVNTLYIGC